MFGHILNLKSFDLIVNAVRNTLNYIFSAVCAFFYFFYFLSHSSCICIAFKKKCGGTLSFFCWSPFFKFQPDGEKFERKFFFSCPVKVGKVSPERYRTPPLTKNNSWHWQVFGKYVRANNVATTCRYNIYSLVKSHKIRSRAVIYIFPSLFDRTAGCPATSSSLRVTISSISLHYQVYATTPPKIWFSLSLSFLFFFLEAFVHYSMQIEGDVSPFVHVYVCVCAVHLIFFLLFLF